MANTLVKITGKILNGTATAGEKILPHLALPAAVFSVNEDYNFLLRPLGGIVDTGMYAYRLVGAVISNEGFRDVAGGVLSDALNETVGIAQSIFSDPADAGLTALYSYGVCKLFPYASKKIRTKLKGGNPQNPPHP